MKSWLRNLLRMRTKDVPPQVMEYDDEWVSARDARRAQLLHERSNVIHRQRVLTHTGEMQVIQRRAEKQWLTENAETVIIPRIEA